MGNRMRTVWLCALGLVVSFLAAPAGAQNFFAGAAHEAGYVNYGQTGDRGFFGRYGIDNSAAPGTFSSFNGWVGNYGDETRFLTTGSNVAHQNTAIQVDANGGNAWARVKGRYKIEPYVAGSSTGAFVAMSPGQLSTWSLMVTPTPGLSIKWGKEEFKKAAGLQFDLGRSEEYFIVERTVDCPDLLGRLVRLGLLPRRAMSWFNPERWPMYVKKAYDKYTDPVTKRTYEGYQEPDDLIHGDFTEDKDGNRTVTSPLSDTIDAENDESDLPAQRCDIKDPDEPSNTDDVPFKFGYCGPGHLTMGLGFLPWRKLPDHPMFNFTPANDPYYAPGFLIPQGLGFDNFCDVSMAPTQNLLGYIEYSSHDLILGAGGTYMNAFLGPELVPQPDTRRNTPATDFSLTEGWIRLQYDNGWLRLNSEADWYYRTVRYQRSASGSFTPGGGISLQEFYPDGRGSVFAPRYVQSWRYMVEAGLDLSPSPASITAFYCSMPGPDRRHGILIDRQPFVRNTAQAGSSVFLPYSMLFAPRYGSGWNTSGDMGGSHTYALKFDYMLAANLMLQGSVLHARRSSKSFGMGFIRPLAGATVLYNLGERDDSTTLFSQPSPSIPEDDLGWEVTAGALWNLTEKWSVQGKVAYWQPGKWFNYACVDRSVPSWDQPNPANNWGINPNRKIDPVFGFQIIFSTSY